MRGLKTTYQTDTSPLVRLISISFFLWASLACRAHRDRNCLLLRAAGIHFRLYIIGDCLFGLPGFQWHSIVRSLQSAVNVAALMPPRFRK